MTITMEQYKKIENAIRMMCDPELLGALNDAQKRILMSALVVMVDILTENKEM